MGIIVSDTFTEGSDTNLDSHTPDTGTGWTKEAGDTGRDLVVYAANDEVNANLQRDETLLYSSQPNPTTADVDVEFDSRLVAAADSNIAWGVFARLADISNYYSAATLTSASTADKRIHKRVSGTDTELASGDNGTTTGDVFRFDVRDATKKLYQNASEVLSTTDNDLTGAGKAGLASGEFMSSLGATDPLVSFDNYVLTEVDAGTTVNASTDSLVLTEYTANVNAETSVTGTVDALVITEYSAIVSLGANINATVDTLTLTEYAANINLAVNLNANFDTLVLTTYGATVTLPAAGTEVNAGFDALAITEYPASINAEVNVGAALATLTITEYSANISLAIGPTIDGLATDVITTNYGEGSYYSIGDGTYYKF